MFELETGRKQFYQWDTGQRLIVNDKTVIEAHFCNRTSDCSLTCEVYTDGGKRVVDVPNILLQDNMDIRVYAYCGNYTKVEQRYEVVKRSKPSDYVYTETEVKSWEALASRAETALNEIDTLAADVSEAEEQRKAAEDDRNAAAVEMVAATEEAKTAAAEAQTALETLISNAHAAAIVAENTASIVAVDDAAATFAVKVETEGSTIYRTGKNLCSLGTVDFKQYTEKKLTTPIPAGTYTFSTTATTIDTDRTYSIIHFVMAVGGVVKMMIGRNKRVSAPLVVSAPITAIRFYASENYADGAGDTATFADIQIEVGTVATDYEAYNGVAIAANGTQLEMLKGYNAVWSDSGETTLAYIADTKLYIDGKFTELQNAIVSLGSNV